MGHLEYELTTDDFITSSIHASMTHPGMGRVNRTTRIVFTVILAVLAATGAMGGGLEDDPVFTVGFGVVVMGLVGVLVWFGWTALLRWEVRLRFASMKRAPLRDGAGLYHLGWNDVGVREDAPHHTLFATWAQVSRLDETPDYLILYLNALEALIVPKRVGPGVEDFAREARARIPAEPARL